MSENEVKSEFEELSAWLDNEDSTLNEEQSKLPENQQVAEDFRKIDAAIAKVSATPQAPSHLVDKIAARCKEESKTEPIQFSRHFYRIAAIVAACLVIAVIYKNEKQTDENISQITDRDTKPKTVPVMSTAKEDKTEKFDKVLRGNPSPATPSGDINLIGTNDKNETNIATVELEREIKHVWISDNPEKTVKLLRQLTDKINDMETMIDPKGNTTLTMTLIDKELIEIVNRLSKEGNDLVSKQLPQPKEMAKIEANGKMVKYTISVIRKN